MRQREKKPSPAEKSPFDFCRFGFTTHSFVCDGLVIIPTSVKTRTNIETTSDQLKEE